MNVVKMIMCEVNTYKEVVIAAFLNCLPQSAFADSMVVTGRWNGCGSIALIAALVLERAEKLRTPRTAACEAILADMLMVWSGGETFESLID